ncbi:hypothetical protein OIE75_41060 (plasmid) [Streptomyces sp. NBC_01723]|uniref:hypothetical protein n=1 Tax=Streptomyces sp. NBC_01723 TaxID=2975921 RepID=UPI002E2FD0B4|nr:hypothetical protein [Streptomyces sp. NBC_01723]
MTDQTTEPHFGSPDCTCIPYTRKYGTPRYCGPNETVDDISGWERGTDCPHHAPAAPLPPADQTALRDRITTAISKWHRDPEQPLYEQGADAVLAELASLAVNAGRALQDEKRHYEIACRENTRLRAELESERDASRRLLAQRQEMAEERYAWQQRGDRAEAEVKRLRADRAAVLESEAALILKHCPDHGPQDQDGVWMDCHCAVVDDMRKRAAELRRVADETAATETHACKLCSLAADATEYRIPVPEDGGTTLLLRRQNLAHGTGWAATAPGYGGGRAWTTEGWQDSISALSVDRLFCWPDAPTAADEARRALAADGPARGEQEDGQ